MSDRDEIGRLVAAGAYIEAARLCAERGELRRAIQLYERVWRFADAIPLALAAGDRPLAVRLCLDAGDPTRAVSIAADIAADDAAALRAAAEAFVARGRPYEAAVVADRANDPTRAAELYRKANALLEAGRALENAGALHDAGLLYEQLATHAGEDEAAAARLALGRLLGRVGRHEDAARALQSAARSPHVRRAAERALCLELLALGWRTAATEILERLRAIDPDLPSTPEGLALRDAASPQAPSQTDLLRNRFRMGGLIGAGATGRVYVAEDTLLGRPVALKLLAVGAGASGAEREGYGRFTREALAAGRLRHPNIVALWELDETMGLMVMEHMPGGTLADRLATDGPLSPAAARRLALDLLAALGAAHARGIIHRDVKPANVFFDAAGNAKLGDFGAAHLIDFGQTQTGGFLGSVAYMSPEQITGAPLTPAADLYGLGAMLFEALTGRWPFPGPDIVAQHLGEQAPRPTELRPGLSPAHDEILLRALAKAPVDRYASAEEMAQAIAGWPAVGSVPPARAAPRPAAPIAPAPAPPGVLIGLTAAGRLVQRRDERVGRQVLVEERREPMDDAELARLRALAAAGGPWVQRVLAVAPDRRAITYELVDGPVQPLSALPRSACERTQAAHDALRSAGLIATNLAAMSDTGPVLLVAPPIQEVQGT